MRAADADREQVAERLRGALTEGRLDLDEYDDRVREAYAAKTYADLDKLLADLPGPRPAAQSQVAPREDAPKGGRGSGRTVSTWVFVVGVNVALWATISLFARRPVYPWFFWVAIPWGFAILSRRRRWR